MKYALLIYASEETERWDRMPADERQAIRDEYVAIAREPGTVGGEQLQPSSAATTIRVEHGDLVTTDGPYVETKEMLGGFYLIDARDLDGALEVAHRIPAARMGGAVEIRPLVEMS
jgi:hypothetical protein